MLRSIKRAAPSKAAMRIAIVASRYNAQYVDGMLRDAKDEIKRAGVTNVQVVRVPGAFEIPVIAARLAAAQAQLEKAPGNPTTVAPLIIICFGVIFQGQTSHAQHIGLGVTYALAQIQTQHCVPVIHAVFVFDKEEHARTRCLGTKYNRGTEAAHTALAMGRLIGSLQ